MKLLMREIRRPFQFFYYYNHSFKIIIFIKKNNFVSSDTEIQLKE